MAFPHSLRPIGASLLHTGRLLFGQPLLRLLLLSAHGRFPSAQVRQPSAQARQLSAQGRLLLSAQARLSAQGRLPSAQAQVRQSTRQLFLHGSFSKG